MPYENFLINPIKKIKRKNPGAAWHFQKAAEANLDRKKADKRDDRMVFLGKQYAHNESRFEAEKLGMNPKLKGKGGDIKMARRRKHSIFGGFKRRMRHNPFGEELVIAGLNPRRRYGKHRKSRAKGRRRGYRRNPVSSALGKPLQMVTSNLPYMITGGISALATVAVPKLLKFTDPLPYYGAQAATAVGGGIVAGMVAGKQHGMVWTVVGGSVILADVLKNYVLKGLGLSGYIGDDEYEDYEYVEAYPDELSAYPDELEDYGEEEELEGIGARPRPRPWLRPHVRFHGEEEGGEEMADYGRYPRRMRHPY